MVLQNLFADVDSRCWNDYRGHKLAPLYIRDADDADFRYGRMLA